MKKLLLGLVAIFVALVISALLWANFAPPEQVARVAAGMERSRAGLEPRTLEIPGFQIAYLEGGQGDPLVLLHGIGADKDNWTRVARHLTGRFRVIAVDLPGFGESSKPADQTYRIQDQVERVRLITQALGLKSFDLGGNSMGGMISATYAARYPDDVRSLWLIAAAGAWTAQPSEMMRRLEAGEKIPLFARTPEEFDEVIGFVMADRPYIPPSIRKVLAQRAAGNYDLHAKIFDQIRTQSTPLEQIVPGLRTPTRIVWGEQDRVLHVSGATVLAGLMGNASTFVLPGVGHLPMLERPRAVAEDYIAFRSGLE